MSVCLLYTNCAKIRICVCTFFSQKKYITVPQLRVARGSHVHQGIHKKSPHHEELQLIQRQKPVTTCTSCYETVASAASVSQHHGSMAECHDVNEQQKQQQYEVSFGQQEVVILLDPNDPALKSKKLDFVNLPLGEGYVIPQKSQGQT